MSTWKQEHISRLCAFAGSENKVGMTVRYTAILFLVMFHHEL